MPRDGTATRERILTSAEQLVIENGYAATSVDQVIAADWVCAQLTTYDLGGLDAFLTERASAALIARAVGSDGWPLANMNGYRLVDVQDDQLVAETFEPAARRWLAIDFDDLPCPAWNPDDLARRHEAIARDRREHGQNAVAAEGDPAPIDPVRD